MGTHSMGFPAGTGLIWAGILRERDRFSRVFCSLDSPTWFTITFSQSCVSALWSVGLQNSTHITFIYRGFHVLLIEIMLLFFWDVLLLSLHHFAYWPALCRRRLTSVITKITKDFLLKCVARFTAFILCCHLPRITVWDIVPRVTLLNYLVMTWVVKVLY